MTPQRSSLAPEGAAVEAAEPEGSTPLPLEEILPTPVVEIASPAPARVGAEGIRTARLAVVSGRRATVILRGQQAPIEAAIAPEVDPAIVEGALATGDSVLVELAAGEQPLVVGVLHTRRPSAIRLKATTIEIEGEEEVLVRSGRGALRIRADGEVEVVGSRISAASRGLFRIVGRILRLN